MIAYWDFGAGMGNEWDVCWKVPKIHKTFRASELDPRDLGDGNSTFICVWPKIKIEWKLQKMENMEPNSDKVHRIQ